MAKNTIKHTRKNKFHKGLHKKKLCQAIWGDSDSYLGGVLGKYIKHSHLVFCTYEFGNF